MSVTTSDYLITDVANESAAMNATPTNLPQVEGMIWRHWVILVEAVAALLVNLYLLLASRWLREPIGVNLRLCVSLLASNVGAALFVVLSVSLAQQLSDCWTLVIEAFKLGAYMTSMLHLLALAVNHYCGILYPLRRPLFTATSLRVGFLVVYALPVLMYLLFYSLMPGQGFRGGQQPWAFSSVAHGCSFGISQTIEYRAFVGVPFITFVVVVTYLYASIFAHMRQRRHDPLLMHAKKTHQGAVKHTGRKLFITLLLLAGSAVVGWLPTMTQYILLCPDCLLPMQSDVVRINVGFYTLVLMVLKLLLDAFIYASRLVEIRFALWSMHSAFCQHLPGAGDRVDLPRAYQRYVAETKERRPTLIERSILIVQRKAASIVGDERDRRQLKSVGDPQASTTML